jgi:hypothetical protein
MRFTLLRWFVVAALLANLAYAAWYGGALAFVGLAPATQRDPGRIEQQVRPNAVRVLTPAATAEAIPTAASAAVVGPLPPRSAATTPEAASAPPAGASAPAATVGDALACLEIGPLEGGAAIESAERTLAAVLPQRAWAREQRPAPAQYAVFVGPILSRDAARQRREELVKLKISFEAIELPEDRSGEKQGGYALGRHDNESAALAALDDFRERGLRNAKVVLTRQAGSPRTWLRLDRLTATQADAVRALAPAPLGGQKPAECVIGSVMSVRVPR